MDNHAETGASLLAKIAGLWALVGITSWSEAASFATFCLTTYILFRYLWRDMLRPFLESIGVMKPREPQQRDADSTLEGR